MALSPLFDFYNYKPTQDLIADLITQMISIYGHEVYYIPRNVTNFDKLYETDDQSNYSTTIPVEVYIENIDGFEGQQDIFTKFGLDIKDSITLCMARNTFNSVIKPITGKERPYEGDIIFFTANKKCFQITFVNNKELFYPMGSLPTFQMELNLFQYSDETFNTNIPEIDNIQQTKSLNAKDYELTLPDGTGIADESNNVVTSNKYDEQNIDPIADNQDLKDEDVSFIDFSTNNIFGGLST